jgi:hypothetical protein
MKYPVLNLNDFKTGKVYVCNNFKEDVPKKFVCLSTCIEIHDSTDIEYEIVFSDIAILVDGGGYNILKRWSIEEISLNQFDFYEIKSEDYPEFFI